MSGLTSARLLAPLALVLSALALLIVVTTGGGDPSPSGGGAAEPTATASPEAEEAPEAEPTPAPEDEEPASTYTVQSGDSPSSIAESEGVTVEALLEANPDIDPDALAVGDELEIPDP